MKREHIKGSSMVMKMLDRLTMEGWTFTANDSNIISHAKNNTTGESVSFPSIGNLKIWLYRKALN